MTVVLLTGRSGAGKSTLAERLTEPAGTHFLSERTICRGITDELGYQRNRDMIAAVGAVEVGSQMIGRTVAAVESVYDGQLTVVDGAYSRRLRTAILEQLGQRVGIYTVAIEAPYLTRLERVAQRLGTESLKVAADEIALLDDIKDAWGMPQVIAAADLHLDGLQPTEQLCTRLNDHIQWRAANGPQQL